MESEVVATLAQVTGTSSTATVSSIVAAVTVAVVTLITTLTKIFKEYKEANRADKMNSEIITRLEGMLNTERRMRADIENRIDRLTQDRDAAIKDLAQLHTTCSQLEQRHLELVSLLKTLQHDIRGRSHDT